MQRIESALVRYYGSKWTLADWIIRHFPPHDTFVDVFGGSGAITLSKHRSKFEVFNDLSGNVVNFFRVVRDHPDELQRRMMLTPYARAEFEVCRQACLDDPIESARRFMASSHMGISCDPHDATTGMRTVTTADDSNPAMFFKRKVEADLIHRAAKRLVGVLIEQRDALQIIDRFNDPNTLLYCDPPYVADTRSNRNVYDHEWDDQQHIDLITALSGSQSKVVLSGYDHELYRDLCDRHGWHRVDKEAQCNIGTRIEVLWLSPNAAFSPQKMLF